MDVAKLCFEGPEEQLSQTKYTQPAMVAFAIGVTKLLKEAGFESIETYRVSPDYMFTTEIYAEDYIGGGAGDYLLIAR